MTLAAMEESLWEEFCDAVDRPQLVDVHGATDPAVIEAVRTELAELFQERSGDEWMASLADESIVAPVNSLQEVLTSEHLQERGLVQRGDEPRVGFPALVDGVRPNAGGDVPTAGEHTAAVLRDADMDETVVQRVVGE